MRSVFTLLFLQLFISSHITSDRSKGWNLRKNENGIAVYTRYASNSDIKEIWVVDTVKTTLSAVVAVLLDTKNYSNWVYRCRICKTLKIINDKEQYDYELTSVPWPFEDRDVITDSKISQDSVTKVVTVNSKGAPDYIPDSTGVVRIKNFHSIYTLTKLTDGRIKVDYALYGDPGGNIPAWLINANIVVGPYNSTLEMNKQLAKYQSANYSFIIE